MKVKKHYNLELINEIELLEPMEITSNHIEQYFIFI